MAKESDVSWVAGVVGWGMPLVVLPVGTLAALTIELVSLITHPLKKKPPVAPPDYREEVLQRLAYHRQHPAHLQQPPPAPTSTAHHR